MAEELRELILKQPEPVKKLSAAALISFVAGISTHFIIFANRLLDIKFNTALVIGSILALLAIIAGHIARRNIRRGDGYLTGVILADVGLVLGYILIILLIIILLLTLLGVSGLFARIEGILGLP